MSRTLVAPACWWSSHTTDRNVLLQILVPESLTDQTAAQIFVSLSSVLLTTACHVLQIETILFNDRQAQQRCAISALHLNGCDMHDRFALFLVVRLSRLYVILYPPRSFQLGQCQMMLCFMPNILCNACHTLKMLLPVYRSTP